MVVAMKSRIMKEIHGSISRMHSLGVADDQTMNEFNQVVFKHDEQLTATPRDYQIDIINKAKSHYATESRGQLILPCGTGKTLTSLWIKENLQAKKVIFCVPSLILLKQTKMEWEKNQSTKFPIYFICSESDIDRSKDEVRVDLSEFGSNVSTDSNEVFNFIRLNQNDGFIIYSTYHSLPVLAKAIAINAINLDLIICDEAHKTVSVENTGFTLIHDNNKLPSRHRLYMTATPKIMARYNKHKKSDFHYAVHMDNADIYGKEFYRMSFAEAIERDILVNYKLIVVGVGNKEIKQLIMNKTPIAEGATFEDLANNLALHKVMTEYKAKHALTFHNSIKAAHDFSIRHKELFNNVYSNYVCGIESTAIRESKINEFIEENIGVLSNARCLTEGVDIPDIDVVYFSDPKSSVIDITQAIGRTLRKSKNPNSHKKEGLIIVPVYYSETDTNNIELEIESSRYSTIINVARALANEDEKFYNNILNANVSPDTKNKLELLGVNFIGFENISVAASIQESLRTNILINTIDSWDIKYYEFKCWIEKYKAFPSQQKDKTTNEITLGKWATIQRLNSKKGLLSNLQITKLNEIGFIWDIKNEIWYQHYKEFNDWVSVNQKYPNKYTSTTVFENKLAEWVSSQRFLYGKGELEEERINQLNKINFIWDAKGKTELWNQNLKDLKQWIFINNKYPTKLYGSSEEKYLANWVWLQRRAYKEGKLDEDRRDKLNEIGFLYSPQDEMWEKNFNNFKLFIINNLKYPKNRKNKGEETGLARWVEHQRKCFINKKPELTLERINKLNEIGFIWIK